MAPLRLASLLWDKFSSGISARTRMLIPPHPRAAVVLCVPIARMLPRRPEFPNSELTGIPPGRPRCRAPGAGSGHAVGAAAATEAARGIAERTARKRELGSLPSLPINLQVDPVTIVVGARGCLYWRIPTAAPDEPAFPGAVAPVGHPWPWRGRNAEYAATKRCASAPLGRATALAPIGAVCQPLHQVVATASSQARTPAVRHRSSRGVYPIRLDQGYVGLHFKMFSFGCKCLPSGKLFGCGLEAGRFFA